MKLLIKTAILAGLTAFAFAPAVVTADPWYHVGLGIYDPDATVEMRSRAHGEGKVICVIPTGEFLHRNHERNWSRWIHVQWKKFPAPFYVAGGNEWDFKDARGKWCPIWNRRGWIDKADPDLKVADRSPDRPPNEILLRRVPRTW